MKKKLFMLLAVVTLMVVCLTISVSADDSGTCGDNLTWEFDTETGALSIDGSGYMDDYYTEDEIPWAAYREEIKSINLCENILSIGHNAFTGCTKLSEIIIPDNITKIGGNAFANCTSLENVSISNKVTELIGTFSNCSALKHVTVPDSVETLAQTFSYCHQLRSCVLPDGLKEIGYATFVGCRNMSELIMPNSVTYIGKYAFESCYTLKSVTLSKNVEIIDEYAFDHCEDLTNIVLPVKLRVIGNFAFFCCKDLTEVTIYNNLEQIGADIFDSCDNLTTINFIGTEEEWSKVQSNWPIEFTPICNPPINSSEVYHDVKPTSWFKGAVDFVVTNGLMNGMTADKFEPNTTMSRAMLVTVLWRLEGEPEANVTVPFTDLKQTWYKDAVAWAYENSIVNGTSDTKFSPNGDITREQMAAILYRYSEYRGVNTSGRADLSSYPDAGRVHDYALDAFSWANAVGLITGTTGNDGTVKLAPRASATRAQVATILMRYCENN